MRYIITEEQFENNKDDLMNYVKLSDLGKEGHWDPRRHVRKLKGINLYTIEDGVLTKRENMPQRRMSWNWGYSRKKIYYLTNEEAQEVNKLLTQARELEFEAKRLREMAKEIYKKGESNI